MGFDVFRAGDGFPCYRIPGMVVTASGRIMAYCEARNSGNDWDAHGVACRHSDDGGEHWSQTRLIVPTKDCTVNNPVMIASRSGKLHFLWLTDYRQLFWQVSEDDGAHFSEPVALDVLETFRGEYDWTCAAVGPCHGVELPNGRLVATVWLARGEGRNHFPSVISTIVSDDEGRTWQRGQIVGDAEGMESPNEMAVAARSDGVLVFSIRHRGENRVRYQMFSDDGVRFDGIAPMSEFVDPKCCGGLAYDGMYLFGSHCDSDSKREKLTVRASMNGGASWPFQVVVDEGIAGYSDLAVEKGRSRGLFCFYERENAQGNADVPEALTFVRV